MKPILKYLKNFFIKKEILGDYTGLTGLVKADALLAKLVNENKVPGLAITVLDDGKTVFQQGYGFADIANNIPMDPQHTILRVGSVSKPIAATALAIMVEEGVIDLDASFYQYVPYYPKKEYDFTIKQLASHTSGIRGYEGKEYALNKPYSIKESLDIFKDDPLLYKPGENYIYNTFDWVMISLAMQEASGVPFDQYVRDKVLLPLGLNDTQAEIPGQLPENTAVFYSKMAMKFRKATPVDNRWKLAGGGYLSTAVDIAKFGQAYLEKRITDKEVLKQFLTSSKYKDELTWYGLGWEVSNDPQGRSYYGHVGNGVGVYSNFYVYPAEKMVFSIIINCTNPKVQAELNEIIDTIVNSSTS
ncbi:MAG: serine hydrolase domain-containing protein [Flavobacteriaceae bacterium]